MAFWKKRITSDEYAECIGRIIKVEHENANLKFFLEKIESSQALLRGQVSRKLGGAQQINESEISKDELDELRSFIAQMGYAPNRKD
jgi:hypothetical protein